MKRTFLFLITCLLLGATTQAQWGNRIKGNNQLTTETRTVGDYDEIAVSHLFKVELVPGREGTLKLEGEENLMEYVHTEVRAGRLVIAVEKGVQLDPSRESGGIKIEVPVEDLRGVEVGGAADLRSEHAFSFTSFEIQGSGAAEIRMALRSETIRVDLSGASEVHLEGKTTLLEAKGSGASNLHAFDLEATEVRVDVSGAGDLRVRAEKALDARAAGAGSIRYKGNPGTTDKRASRAASIRKG